jgi:Putative beta-lactamase-inhibitor-like, PepSY-like
MKKVIIVLLMVAGLPAFAQKLSEARVPSAAKSAFETKFPGMKDIKWEKEKGNFEANFIENGKKSSAIFDEKGNWIETETAVSNKELPFPILQYVTQNFNNKQISEASKILKAAGGINYEVVVGKKELLFGPNGQLISTENK